MDKRDYYIYTEFYRKTKDYRKRIVKGMIIRIDLFNNFPLWKVTEFLKVKNWIIEKNKGHKSENYQRYYIKIL